MSEEELVKLMKRIEIDKPWEKRVEKNSPEYYADISESFLEHYEREADPRFLNTALKLNGMLRDSKEPPKKISRLTQMEEKALRGLRESRGLD